MNVLHTWADIMLMHHDTQLHGASTSIDGASTSIGTRVSKLNDALAS